MTAVPDAVVAPDAGLRSDPGTIPDVEPPAADTPDSDSSGPRRLRVGSFSGVIRWTLALGAAVVLYALFLAVNGADPVEALRAMWDSAFGDSTGIGETLIRAAPLLLGALAVVVPARAGLFNIGGQGQMVMGAIGAVGMSFALDGSLPQAATLVLLLLAGAAAGAAWSAIPAVLRLTTHANEAITSLLLNYVAGLVLSWLVFERWKDPASPGSGLLRGTRLAQPPADPVGRAGARRHPRRGRRGVRDLVAAAFDRLGLPARRARRQPRGGTAVGLPGRRSRRRGDARRRCPGRDRRHGGGHRRRGRLRPDMLAGYGYIAFLASWLARHHPLKAIVSSIALAAIFVGGFGLKISAGLSGAAVNVLMALVLLAVLGFAQRKEV